MQFYFWILEPSRSCFSTFEKKNVKWGRKDRLKKRKSKKANQKIVVYFKIKRGYSQVPSKGKCSKIVLLLLLSLACFELMLVLASNYFKVKHFSVICLLVSLPPIRLSI